MKKVIEKIKAAVTGIRRVWRRLQVFIERGTPTLPVSTEETECSHCGLVFRGNFCPRCGQNRAAGKGKPRFLKTFREAYPQLSNNFLRTIFHLLCRPGYMIRDYFRGHRVIYQSPVSTFLIAISVLALCTNIGHRIAPARFTVSQESEFEQFRNEVAVKLTKQTAHHRDPKMKEAYNQWHAHQDKTPSSRMAVVWDVVKEKLTSDITLYLFAFFPLMGVISYALFYRRKFDGRRLTLMEHYIIYVYIFALSNFFDLFDSSGLLSIFYIIWTYRGLYRLSWWKSVGYTFLLIFIASIFMMVGFILFVLSVMGQMMTYYG